MVKFNRFIFWIPRVVSILFILFLALFSLDVFDSCAGFWDCALGLLMHNIPVFILIIILAIAWKYELVGAVVFGLAGLLYITQMAINGLSDVGFKWYMLSYSLIIAGPAFLIAILFYLNWKQKRRVK